MKHTKEPWEARRDPSYYGIVSEVYAGDKFILGTGGVHSPSELEANTKRIVACVNACAGMENPLEEIAELKRQLTWRPVSEKPEKAGVNFVEGKPYVGCESTVITTAYFDGEIFLWYVVVRWLPIPPAPAPEGEVK